MTETWKDIANDIRKSSSYATSAIVDRLFDLGYSKTGHPLKAAIDLDIRTNEGEFTPDAVAQRLFGLGYRIRPKTFKINQSVRVVAGYEGMPNLFADGFQPVAGMVGTIYEVPQEDEALDDDLGTDIPTQYVVDFGNGRWDTFIADELEAV